MSDTNRADTPDISQFSPATGQVGEPASGTYGERAALAELERSLPPAQEAAVQETPGGGEGGGVMPPPPPSGALPRSITAPSTRPNEPLSTPLAQQIPVGETPSQQQRQMLEAWARDPGLRQTTRLWAQAILDSLVES